MTWGAWRRRWRRGRGAGRQEFTHRSQDGQDGQEEGRDDSNDAGCSVAGDPSQHPCAQAQSLHAGITASQCKLSHGTGYCAFTSCKAADLHAPLRFCLRSSQSAQNAMSAVQKEDVCSYLQDRSRDSVACIGAEHHQDAQSIHARQLSDSCNAGVEAECANRPAHDMLALQAPIPDIMRRCMPVFAVGS